MASVLPAAAAPVASANSTLRRAGCIVVCTMATTSTPKNATTRNTTDKPRTNDGLSPPAIVGITVVGLALFVIVIVCTTVAVKVYRTKKRGKRVVKTTTAAAKTVTEPPPSLKRLKDDSTNALALETLRAETAKVMRDDDPSAAEDLINRRIAGDNAEWVGDVVRGGLRHVTGCRYPRMEIRRDSQLTLLSVFPTKQGCLHMTKLSDYFGNTLLVSQAPKRVQFAYHWRAIWQERVGVVLWMGSMAEGALKLMDNYVELFAGDQAIYGPFRVITTSTPRRLPEYDEYRVTVRLGNEERQLIFVNEHVWPMYGPTTKPNAVAELIRHTRAHQRDQAKAGLPGFLVHCSTGIEQSPAFLSVYIGFQMWLDCGKVNLIGVMRYVRHQRWQSFTRPNTMNHVRTAFATMLELAESARSGEKAEGGDRESTDDSAETTAIRSCQVRVEEMGRATG